MAFKFKSFVVLNIHILMFYTTLKLQIICSECLYRPECKYPKYKNTFQDLITRYLSFQKNILLLNDFIASYKRCLLVTLDRTIIINQPKVL